MVDQESAQEPAVGLAHVLGERSVNPPFTVSQEPTYNLTVITPTAAIGDRMVRVKRDSQRFAGVVEVEDLPLAYVPGNSLRTRIGVMRDIAR